MRIWHVPAQVPGEVLSLREFGEGAGIEHRAEAASIISTRCCDHVVPIQRVEPDAMGRAIGQVQS